MASEIHPSAQIAESASIGKDVSIGQNVVIDKDVEIGDGCKIYPGSTVAYKTKIGSGTTLYPGTNVGQECTIGKRVELMGSTIAGHVTIDDFAVVSNGGVHQFCRIGVLAFVGGETMLRKDAPPYVAIAPYEGRIQPCYLNKVGAQRAGLDKEAMKRIKEAYEIVFSRGLSVPSSLRELRTLESSPELELIIGFIEKSDRGIYLRRRKDRTKPRPTMKWLNPAKFSGGSERYESVRERKGQA